VSLIMVFQSGAGLVLGADSRKTRGFSLKGPKTLDDSVKFIQLNADWGLLTYGLSVVGYRGITAFHEAVRASAGGGETQSLLTMGKAALERESLEWSRENPAIPRQDNDVGFILAGYDRMEHALRLYHFQSLSYQPKPIRQGCFVAGQWEIADFLIRNLFTEGLTMEKAEKLAAYIFDQTLVVEKTVGGDLHLARVTETDGFQWVSRARIEALAQENARYADFFKEQFSSALIDVSR
jgi:hypothetical protein